jgi:transposase
VPLALPAPAVKGDIRIELQRAGTTVTPVWVVGAARDYAASRPIGPYLKRL